MTLLSSWSWGSTWPPFCTHRRPISKRFTFHHSWPWWRTCRSLITSSFQGRFQIRHLHHQLRVLLTQKVYQLNFEVSLKFIHCRANTAHFFLIHTNFLMSLRTMHSSHSLLNRWWSFHWHSPLRLHPSWLLAKHCRSFQAWGCCKQTSSIPATTLPSWWPSILHWRNSPFIFCRKMPWPSFTKRYLLLQPLTVERVHLTGASSISCCMIPAAARQRKGSRHHSAVGFVGLITLENRATCFPNQNACSNTGTLLCYDLCVSSFAPDRPRIDVLEV